MTGLRTCFAAPSSASWRESIGAEAAAAIVAERVRVVDAELGSTEVRLPGDLDRRDPRRFHRVLRPADRRRVPHQRAGRCRPLRGGTGIRRLTARRARFDGIRRRGPQGHGSRALPRPRRRLAHRAGRRAAARESVERDSRRPAVLRRALDEARKEHGKSGPQSVATAAEEARKEWVDKQLVDYGRLRAQSLGWPDVYTFTKALGERVAEELLTGALPLSVVRPAIVESALRHPYPGWIDGFKMADPLILAFGRGILPEFPGLPDGVLDVIPVDIVVNATLAVAAAPPPAGEPAYFHVGSGARNPLTFRGMYENIKRVLHRPPDAGRRARPDQGADLGLPRRPAGRAGCCATASGRSTLAQQALLSAPAGERTRRWQDDLTREKDRLEFLRKYSELYGVYTEAEVDLHRRASCSPCTARCPADRVEQHGFDRGRRSTGSTTCRRCTARRSRSPCAGRPSGRRQPARSACRALPEAPERRRGRGVRPGGHDRRLQRDRDLPVGPPVPTCRASSWPASSPTWSARLPALPGAPSGATGASSCARSCAATQGADEAGLSRIVQERLGDALLRRSYPQAIRQIRKHRAGRAPHHPHHRHRRRAGPAARRAVRRGGRQPAARPGRASTPASSSRRRWSARHGRRGCAGTPSTAGVDLTPLVRLRRQLLRPAAARGGRAPGRGQPRPAPVPARQEQAAGRWPQWTSHTLPTGDDARGDGPR